MKTIEIEEKRYQIKTNAVEVTIGEYLDYHKAAAPLDDLMQEVAELDDKIRTTPAGEALELYLSKYSERTLEVFLMMIDMILPVSDIPKDILLKCKPEHLMGIVSHCDFNIGEAPPVHKFTFRDCTREQFDEISSELEGVNYFNFTKRKEVRRRMHEIQNVEFVIAEDLGYDSMSQWIQSDSIIKTITNSVTEVNKGNFDSLPKIIANIARPKGEEYLIDNVIRREKIFRDLPLYTAASIGAFFLKTRKLSTLSLGHYSKLKLMKSLLQPHLRQDTTKSMDGSPA
jgi:hypothetical protein